MYCICTRRAYKKIRLYTSLSNIYTIHWSLNNIFASAVCTLCSIFLASFSTNLFQMKEIYSKHISRSIYRFIILTRSYNCVTKRKIRGSKVRREETKTSRKRGKRKQLYWWKNGERWLMHRAHRIQSYWVRSGSIEKSLESIEGNKINVTFL